MSAAIRSRSRLATLVAGLLAAAPAAAASGQVELSNDIAAPVLGLVTEPGQVARVGPTAQLRFHELESEVDLSAWLVPTGPIEGNTGVTATGAYPVFAIATPESLDGTFVSPQDLVTIHSDTEAFEVFWRGEDAGLPPGVAIDAVAQRGDTLLLSFDVAVAIGPFVFEDEDIAFWNLNGGWIGAIGLASRGVPQELDLDGLEERSNGALWLSFDGSATIDGIAFDDDDVLALRLDTNLWTKVVDGGADYGLPDGADLDALGVPRFIFADGFDSGDTSRWSLTAP